MLLTLIIAMITALAGFGGWLLTKIIYNRWYAWVTIPRIVRRECASIDREYEELVRTSRRRPNRPH